LAGIKLPRIVVLWSFGDRVEASSVPLSPSLGRIQPWSGIKPLPADFQQVILIRCYFTSITLFVTYCREDRAIPCANPRLVFIRDESGTDIIRPTDRPKGSDTQMVRSYESGYLISVTIRTALVSGNSKLNFYDPNMMNITI
jgi:hypothetical protein